MLTRLAFGSLVAGMVVLRATPASAESGAAPACPAVEVVEVFAGAPGCEDVGYLVVRADYLRFLEADLAYFYVGSREDDSSELVSLRPWTEAGTNPPQVLIGTANLAQYFGIEPDIVLGPPFPLRPESGWIEGCYTVEYGPDSSLGLNTCEGQAIRWLDNRTAELAVPSPINARGERGQLTGCGQSAPTGEGVALDGGSLSDASLSFAPLCVQVHPEPEPAPTVPDPSGEPPAPQPSGTAGDSSVPTAPPVATAPNEAGTDPGSSDNGSSTDTDDVDAPLQTDNEPPNSGTSTPEAGAHNPTAPNAPPDDSPAVEAGSAVDPGVAQRGLTDDASGCDCALGARQTTHNTSLAGLALLATLLRRRARRATDCEPHHR